MNKSLSKYIDIFWLIFLSSIIFYSILDINNILSTLKEIQKEKIIYSIKTENSTIAPLIKFGFNDVLKEELKHFVKINKEIKFIKIGNIQIGKKQNLIILNFPVTFKNKKIATIQIGYSNNELIYSFFKKYLNKFIIYFIAIFTLVSFLTLFLRKKVKSLNKFAKKVEDIDFKKNIIMPLIDNYFEIKNITNAINKLLAQINAFYINQQNMMKKLTIYKKELETAQKIAEMFTWIYDCNNKKISSHNYNYFKKKIEIKTVEEFMEKIKEKEIILNKIKILCEHKSDMFEEIATLTLNNKNYYFKIEAKINKSKNLIIGICADITKEIQRQEKMSYLAYHDPLTNLVNRVFLKEELKQIASIIDRNQKKIALVFIDLDNFKLINDTFGHETGDQLLIEIANRLKQSIRKSDIASRIGGDEFILVLNNINSKQEIEKKLHQIMKKLTQPIIVNNNKLEVTFSAGIAIYPDDTKDISELFQFSDIAMYDAKKSGKNRFKFINISLQKQIKEFYNTLEELKKAIKNEELILYFQPKINVKNESIEGAEALIRWKHPQKGILTPYYFIDIAEKGGIINLIDSYVLKKTIKTLKEWSKNEKLKNLSLAVNISANKFLEPNFIEELENLIKNYDINPSKLQIEITETISIQNLEYTIKTLKKIKNLGIKIAIDDFGTGYSSLNYIKNIPFDILKIDQSFIRDLLKDKDDLIITKMIVQIAKILNKTTVAEGVENHDILQIIKSLNVDIIQGYLYSKPLEEKKFIKYVDDFENNQ